MPPAAPRASAPSSRRARRGLSLPVAICLSTAAAPAFAFDPFEIQVYDGATNQAGEASLELHANYHHAPSQPAGPGPELPTHKQAHFTLEPALGLTPYWEVGAYVQVAARFDDTLYWAGGKLRSKLVTPEGWDPHWTLGINYEIGAVPRYFDADRYGAEIRPILAYEARFVKLALNPNVEVGFAGEGLRAGPELTPAAAAYLRIPDVAEIGVEYYASLGPVKHVPRLAQQEHYLFGAGNLLALAGWELNAGVGAGLTDGSTDLIAKLIVGHSLGRLWGRDRGHVASGSPARGTARR